jgi:predicted peroxiredoxin
MSKRLFILCTHGPEDAERATIPFVMATAAQASDVEVVMGFQVDGVWLAGKGVADQVTAPGFPPLKDLVAAYQEAGGQMLVCGPCMKTRGVDTKPGLMDGTTVVGAAVFVEEAMKATSTLIY